MLRILGIGNALVDVSVFIHDDSILEKHHLHKGGMTLIDEETETVIEQEMQALHPQMSTGGSTGNAMTALACLGAKPTYVGRIGNDELGRFFMEEGTRQGINEKLITCNEHTGVANTFISSYGERSFGTHLGAAMGLKAEDITEDLFENCDLVHIEGYLVQNHELIEKICKTAKRLGLIVSLDLGSWNIVRENLDFFHHIIRNYVSLVFANREEATALSGLEDAAQSLNYIACLTDTAIVKMGKLGASAMHNGGKRVVVPANKIENVIDTTAAGDYFAAGFLYAFSNAAELRTCLDLGIKLSESIIQVVGTRLSDEAWDANRSYARKILENKQ